MRQLQEGLHSVLQQLSSAPPTAMSSQPATTKAKPSILRRPAKTRLQASAAAVPGLDPSVVAAARAAGIAEPQLKRMGALAAKPGGLADGHKTWKGLLSESEDEEAEEEHPAGDAEADSVDQLGKAVLQMSQILAKMNSKKTDLEELLLDGASLDSGLASSSTGRSKAAAYVKLCRTLKEDPQTLIDSFERLLAGLPASADSTRGQCQSGHRPCLAGAPLAPAGDCRSGLLGLVDCGSFGLPPIGPTLGGSSPAGAAGSRRGSGGNRVGKLVACIGASAGAGAPGSGLFKTQASGSLGAAPDEAYRSQALCSSDSSHPRARSLCRRPSQVDFRCPSEQSGRSARWCRGRPRKASAQAAEPDQGNRQRGQGRQQGRLEPSVFHPQPCGNSSGGPRLPGSSATPVQALSVWHDFFTSLGSAS